MDPRCRIEMLGPLRLVQSHQTVTRFGTQKAAALLAYLGLHLGPQPREQVIDLFWPDMDLPAARNNLSTLLTSLRRQLEPAGIGRGSVLVTTHAQIGLNPAAVTTDIADFERLLQEAERTDGLRPRADALSHALTFYHGDFQPGNYQDWAIREAERLHAQWVGALDQLGDDWEALAQFPEAVALTLQRLTADPYAEGAWVKLVRRHLQAGQPDAAREAVRRLEQLFQEEFGSGPSPVTHNAIQDLLHGLPNTTGSAAPRPLSAPRSLEQPPAAKSESKEKTLAAPSAGLPFWLNRFFGREAEMAHLADRLLLSKEASPLTFDLPERPCRLLTLTGPGGAGKTRLAAEFARLAAERSGAWCGFVPLSDLQVPAQIPAQIVQVLGLPSSLTRSPLEQALAFFQERDRPGAPPTLLILDNLEHLLEPSLGLEETVPQAAEMVRFLLKNTASLVVLCTSRHPLGISGERLLPLGPLPLPPALGQDVSPEALASLARIPSVRLYTDRAQEVRPDFGLTVINAPSVCALCHALEGSPLALELAASWVRLLPPRKMWERLSEGLGVPEGRQADLPARHRSLSAALEWSWRLLTEQQQRLLSRLSVFRGGWTLMAASSVCEERGALGLLADLGEASLVESTDTGDGEARYRLLETVRAFSQQKFKEQGEWETLQGRHADFFRTLAAQAEPNMRGPQQKQWLDALEAEHDNLRTALDWYSAPTALSERFEAGLRLAAALAPFWRARGYLQEGHDRCILLLSRSQAAAHTAAHADALNRAGEIATLLTAYSEAEESHTEALCISREIQHVSGEADAMLGLGTVHYWRQDYTAAARFFKGSLALRHEQGREWGAEYHRLWGEAATYHSLGNLAMRHGENAEALAFFERALALRRQQGDTVAVASTLGGLGQTARAAGNLAEASLYITEALRLFEAAGQRWTVALCLSDLSQIAEAQGEIAQSVRLLGAAAALRERFHFPAPPAERAGYEERVADLRTQLGTEAFDVAWAEGWELSQEPATDYLLQNGLVPGRSLA